MTRGERNNNPGNLDRTAIRWQGQSEDQPDSRFVKFDSPEWGIRALAKTLLTYGAKYGIRTVRGIINRWAPSNENNTEAYIASVAKHIGVGDTEAIDLSDRSIMQLLVVAIIKHENGRVTYTPDVIRAGIELAYA